VFSRNPANDLARIKIYWKVFHPPAPSAMLDRRHKSRDPHILSEVSHGMFGQAGCGSLRHASSVDWFVVLRQSCLSTTVAARVNYAAPTSTGARSGRPTGELRAGRVVRHLRDFMARGETEGRIERIAQDTGGGTVFRFTLPIATTGEAK